jgi:hypothetical protein
MAHRALCPLPVRPVLLVSLAYALAGNNSTDHKARTF